MYFGNIKHIAKSQNPWSGNNLIFNWNLGIPVSVGKFYDTDRFSFVSGPLFPLSQENYTIGTADTRAVLTLTPGNYSYSISGSYTRTITNDARNFYILESTKIDTDDISSGPSVWDHTVGSRPNPSTVSIEDSGTFVLSKGYLRFKLETQGAESSGSGSITLTLRYLGS